MSINNPESNESSYPSPRDRARSCSRIVGVHWQIQFQVVLLVLMIVQTIQNPIVVTLAGTTETNAAGNHNHDQDLTDAALVIE